MNDTLRMILGSIFLISILSVCVLVCSSDDSSAEEYTYDGVVYNLYYIDSGDITNYYSNVLRLEDGHADSITITKTISYNGHDYVLNSAQYDAFQNDLTLKELTIPKDFPGFSVSMIKGCLNLESIWTYGSHTGTSNTYYEAVDGVLYSIYLYDSDKQSGNASLVRCPQGYTPTSFTVPSEIYTEGISCYISGIYGSAFEACQNIERVDLGNIGYIESSVFKDCPKLKNVTMSYIYRIGSDAFSGCTQLESVSESYNSTYYSIYENAFKDCVSLKSYNFTNVNSVGIGSFSGCTSLMSVESEKISTVSDNAFLGCTSLVHVSTPNVTGIGYSVFSGCSNLTTVDLGSYNASRSLIIRSTAFEGCSGITELTIDNASVIETDAFKDLVGVEELSIRYTGCGLSLPDYSSLVSITVSGVSSGLISESVWKKASDAGASFEVTVNMTAIVDEMFRDASGINKVTFSNKDITIGNKAFLNCTSLERMIFAYSSVTANSDDSFSLSDTKAVSCNVLYLFSEDPSGLQKTVNDHKNSLTTYTFLKGLVTLKFDTTVDDKVETVTCYVGDVIVPPEDPKKPSTQTKMYVFTGWEGYTEGMVATADMTFKAKFEETDRLYTIEFENKNGRSPFTYKLKYGDEIVKPSETLTKMQDASFKYEFLGWVNYTDGMKVTEDRYFSAYFKGVAKDVTVVTDTSMTADSYAAELTADQISKLKAAAQNGQISTFTMKMTGGTIKVPTSVLRDIKDGACMFSILPSDTTVTNAEYYDISVGDNSNFSGKVTVTLSYDKSIFTDASRLKAYCQNDSGSKELIGDTVYDSANGTISFETGHMSRFMITEEKDPLATKDNGPTLIIAGVAALITILCVILAYIRRR